MVILWWVLVWLGGGENKPFIMQGKAQGTTYMIKYMAADSMLLKKEVDSLFMAVDLSLSLYDTASLISRFNRDGAVEMDEHMTRVVQASLQLYEGSEGAFDITTKNLSAYWGFGTGKLARPSSLRQAKKLTGMDKLDISDTHLRSRRKGVMIDCNGIAQGYTVDLIAELLQARGVADFLVELGGEIRVKGAAEGGRSWTIGIESPSPLAGEWRLVQRSIEIKDRGVTTSGSYRNYVERSGRRYGHVIDPATGKPVDNGVIAVTVVAGTAMDADGLDNALFVMGWQRSLHWLDGKKDVEAYFIYADAAGNIRDTATKGFYALLK